MDKLIELNQISKTFFSDLGETRVLDRMTFYVEPQEIVAILGPSGCGKSTVLNILSGLEPPTSGEMQIHCRLGYMFQKDNLMEWRNILSNVCLGLEITHQKTKENIAYVKELLHKYQLEEFSHHYPKELSGGMRQRVSLIRTLALKPDLLLLDEPFSALDFQTKLLVQNDVHSIIKKEKKAALIVTHDVSEAIALADRVLILSERPCCIKEVIDIDFDPDLTPLERRQNPEFNRYFNSIYQKLNGSIEK